MAQWFGARGDRARPVRPCLDDIAAAVDAVAAARRLDRAEVRAAFEERFTATRMANDYVDAYGELMARTPRATVSRAPIKSRLSLLAAQVDAPKHSLPSPIREPPISAERVVPNAIPETP